jgi:valyl-tRNA synthetase
LKAVNWFENRFNEALADIEQHFNQFRLSEALMSIYKLVWDDFCSWYLEMVKPAYGSPIDLKTLEDTKLFFLKILKLLHPFMPFITEELYHDELFGNREKPDCCVVADYPVAKPFDKKVLAEIELVKQIISEVRNIRNSKQISPKEALPLAIKVNSDVIYTDYFRMVEKLANLSRIELVTDKVAGTSFLIGKDEFYLTPTQTVDPQAETDRINKELEYLRGFLKSVESKLSNERFVQNAKPEVVEIERRKKADAETKIQILEASLQSI